MILPTDKLRHALQKVAPAVPKGYVTTPVTEHVKIEIKGTNVTVTATDLGNTICTTFESTDPGNEVLLPHYKDLSDFVNLERNPIIKLTPDNEDVKIEAGKSKGTINGYKPEDWIVVPEIKGTSHDLHANIFHQMNEKLIPFSAPEDEPNLHGVNLRTREEKLIMEATNRHQYARLEIDKKANDLNVLIKSKVVTVTSGLFEDEELKFTTDGKSVRVEGKEAWYEGKLMEESMPDTDPLLAQFENPTLVKVNNKELQMEIAKAMLFSNDKERIIGLNFLKRELKVNAENINYGKDYSGTIPCEGSEELEVQVDASMIMKGLKQFGEEIDISHHSKKEKPLMMKEGNYLFYQFTWGKRQ